MKKCGKIVIENVKGELFLTGRNVQAIVLAGGFGTRLFPLTDEKPKPLVKIVDKTVLDTVLESVLRTEAKEITVSTHHFSEMIQKECLKYHNKIRCIKENTPLGTAGGVKYCAKEGFDAYLIVSGDGVFDFDLQKAIDLHFEKEPYVTIVCTDKSDPTQFGAVRCTEDGKIYEIIEKPSWKNVKTDLVNTGIYILSQKALEMIPDGVEYDFSKQLFKELLKNNMYLSAIELCGFWCDIGTISEYKNCNKIAISRQNGIGIFKYLRKESKEAFEISPDSYVYKNAVIGKNANIRDKSIVCKNVSVGENCEICDSIVLNEASVGKGSGIYGAIIGENVTVGENCIIPEGCVLGDNCHIKDLSVLRKGTLVKSSAVVYREDCGKMQLNDIKNLFADDGICLFSYKNAFENTALFASSIAVAFTKPDKRPARICVGCDDNSKAYKSAFAAGALEMGAAVTELEKCDMNILSFCSCFLPSDVFVFIQTKGEDGVKLTVLQKHAQVLSDENERKIIKNFEKMSGELQTDFKEERSVPCSVGKVNSVDVVPMYFSYLEEFLEEAGIDAGLEKPRINIVENTKENTPSFEVFKGVLSDFGFQFYYGTDNALKISFSQNVDECLVKYKNTGIDKNHIEGVVLNNLECLNIKGVKTSENIPRTLQNIITNKDACSENTGMCQLLESDGCVMLLSLLCVCTKRKTHIDKLLEEIPEFYVYSDTFVADVNRAGTMKKLGHLYKISDEYRGDGMNLTLPKGNVTIIPSRAKGFKIISEAVNAETAKELCLDIEKIIKEKS